MLSLDAQLAAITGHSKALAAAASADLSAAVEYCPDWTVADLVAHVTDVHWFWGTIAGEALCEPPAEERRPARPSDKELVSTFLSGSEWLVGVLRAADQSTPCWTWFPPQQNIGFITRHQVQEAAVHHFDAANVTGAEWTIASAVAEDCIEEFLTTSVADSDDVVRLGRTLAGSLVLQATDTGRTWTVRQETPRSGLLWSDGGTDPTVTGTAAELLLWLYQRTQLAEQDPELVNRFRTMSSTD